jgi:hypothetical protein
MRKIKYISILTMSCFILSLTLGCSTLFNSTKLPSTKVSVLPGDNVQNVSGLLPRLNTEELIKYSDAILIGKVIEVLPPRNGTDIPPEIPIIYTNVKLQVSRYLYGQSDSNIVSVRVRGGKIGNEVMSFDVEPIFTVEDEVLLFLYIPDNYELLPVPDGIGPADYYKVTGLALGHWAYKDGNATDYFNQTFEVSSIEQKISSIQIEN